MITIPSHHGVSAQHAAMSESAERALHASAAKTARYLYIVGRGGNSAQSARIFEEMRRDMAHAVVELIYDRRTGERRRDAGGVDSERRRADRRRQDAVNEEIVRVGWARVQVD